MMEEDAEGLEHRIRRTFAQHDIALNAISVKRFPGETIVVAEVDANDFIKSVELANDIDVGDSNAFLTVRKSERNEATKPTGVHSLSDPRITALVELIEAKSRTSESQASLEYIQDAADNLAVCLTPRHHLIFGRRGVGKTALMVEAKRIAEVRGHNTFWINLQTLGALDAASAFATTMLRILELPYRILGERISQPLSISRAQQLSERVRSYLEGGAKGNIGLLIADCQQVLNLLGHETQSHLYLFLDDIHYLRMAEQPVYLDMLHAITRDNNVWIKAAGIKHQCRWFMDNPPVGLQTGQDANLIPLDITLETPEKARQFLVTVISTYVNSARISSLSFMPQSSLDRLVIASGGVPRDFLVLAARAIQVARHRSKARVVGIQDVNEAAGQLAKVKLQELEQDAAASIGSAESRIAALNLLSAFLLDVKQTTYFKVDFRDKETHQREYDLLQSLMDLRMVHLIHSSLSDEHQAGQRAEVYMLDLSKFSGTRFKHKLRVLDFQGNNLILKTTGTTEEAKLGNTPKKLLGILRRGPQFDLTSLTDIAQQIAA